MIPKQREYEIFGMGQTRIYIYVAMLPSFIPNKEEWSYRGRTISNKQSNKTLHHSSTSTEHLER